MGTYTVTTLDDETAATTDLATETADGAGLSLREAIAIANAAGGSHTIEFDSGLAGGALTLINGVLSTTADITIDGDTNGDDAADITIDGNDATRILYNDGGAMVLSSLVLTEGSHLNTGGAIYVNAGSLTLEDSTISGSYSSANGGAIGTASGTTLNVSNSYFYANSTNPADNDFGGAIFNRGTTYIDSTTFTNNQSYRGGAIANFGGGALYISNSTFTGNYASNRGGGIYNFSGATLNLASSTFSGNTADSLGGAIANIGEADIANATFAGNAAEYGGAIYQHVSSGNLDLDSSTLTGNYAEWGGGIYSPGGASYASITNSIIIGNEAGVDGDDILTLFGFTNTGGNIIGTNIYTGGLDVGEASVASVFLSAGANPDTGIYSGLLADNGGPVQTVMIAPTGDAVDAGAGAYLPADPLDVDGDLNTAEDLPK